MDIDADEDRIELGADVLHHRQDERRERTKLARLRWEVGRAADQADNREFEERSLDEITEAVLLDTSDFDAGFA